MLTKGFAGVVRASALAGVLLVFGASSVHANCGEEWYESAASTSCDLGTVYGHEEMCDYYAMCNNNEDSQSEASITEVAIEDAADLSNCGGTLTLGACPPPPPTMQEQCEDAWAESAASETCNHSTIESPVAAHCSIQTMCDKDNGIPVFASIVTVLIWYPLLNNCDRELLVLFEGSQCP